MYTDQFGLIVQKDGDGGDTAQRMGWVWFGLFIRAVKLGQPLFLKSCPIGYSRAVQLLEPKADGNWVRHPSQWNDPKDFSRDQARPNIVAMGALGYLSPLARMIEAQLKRGTLFQNKDICGPNELAEIIRSALWASSQRIGIGIGRGIFSACFALLLYPLLVLCDLGLLFNSLFRIGLIPRWSHEKKKFVPMDEDDVGDDLNHIVSLLQARLFLPTPLSEGARLLYIKFRPDNNGNYKLGEESPIMGALAWYFREESGADPQLAELYRPIVERYLS